MNNKTESFKEKLRQALQSTARVISDDLGINPKKKIKNSEKQDLIELENLNSKNDFIKARAETDSKALKKKFSNGFNQRKGQVTYNNKKYPRKKYRKKFICFLNFLSSGRNI